MSTFDDLFPPASAEKLTELLMDPSVSQIEINNHQDIFYTTSRGKFRVNIPVFANEDEYLKWLGWLVAGTDARGVDIRTHDTSSVVEGSFAMDPVAGSVHICMPEITRGAPITTIRKQPMSNISMQDLVDSRTVSEDVANLLIKALQGLSLIHI